MELYSDLASIAATSFISAIILIRVLMKKAVSKGYVLRDMYKPDRPAIPSLGGLAMIGATIIALVWAQFVSHNIEQLLLFYFIAIVFGLYGLADDLFGFKLRYDKVLILFILALPVATLTQDTDLELIVTSLEVGLFYPYFFAPFYIMVIANLINVHSGFNGLSGGLCTLLCIFVGIRSHLVNNGESLLLLAPIVPASLALLWYEKFPARILAGNVGQYFLGGALGAYLVINNMELFGCVIFIPHIINYVFDFWTLKIRGIPLKKFGFVRKDGTIQAPPTMKFVSLKFLVTSVMRLTEPQAVFVLYAITILFCLLGVMLLP